MVGLAAARATSYPGVLLLYDLPPLEFGVLVGILISRATGAARPLLVALAVAVWAAVALNALDAAATLVVGRI